MTHVKIICQGRLRERFWIGAANEYIKRLGAFCKLEILELPDRPDSIKPEHIPKGAFVTALCVEGVSEDSISFGRHIAALQSGGASQLCYLIGGSGGLSENEKTLARKKLSLSAMTWPHHMARVLLLEQLYRAFSIINGGKYHK